MFGFCLGSALHCTARSAMKLSQIKHCLKIGLWSNAGVPRESSIGIGRLWQAFSPPLWEVASRHYFLEPALPGRSLVSISIRESPCHLLFVRSPAVCNWRDTAAGQRPLFAARGGHRLPPDRADQMLQV